MLFQILIAFLPLVHNMQDASDVLPMTESAIEATAKQSILKFQEELDGFLAIPLENRTFDNTIRAWDRLYNSLMQAKFTLAAVVQVHPEKNVRNTADKAFQEIGQILLETLANHPEIYAACVHQPSPNATSGLSSIYKIAWIDLHQFDIVN